VVISPCRPQCCLVIDRYVPVPEYRVFRVLIHLCAYSTGTGRVDLFVTNAPEQHRASWPDVTGPAGTDPASLGYVVLKEQSALRRVRLN